MCVAWYRISFSRYYLIYEMLFLKFSFWNIDFPLFYGTVTHHSLIKSPSSCFQTVRNRYPFFNNIVIYHYLSIFNIVAQFHSKKSQVLNSSFISLCSYLPYCKRLTVELNSSKRITLECVNVA